MLWCLLPFHKLPNELQCCLPNRIMSPLLKKKNMHCTSFEFATCWTHCWHFTHTHLLVSEGERLNKHFLSTYMTEASQKSFSPMSTHHKPHFTDIQTKAQKSFMTGPRSHNKYMAGLGFKPKSPLFSFCPWQIEGLVLRVTLNRSRQGIRAHAHACAPGNHV